MIPSPDEFDSWLGAELDKGFTRSSIRSRAGVGGYKNAVSRRRRLHLGPSAGVPFAGKVAMGLAAATLSLGAVGAAAATAITHSIDPQVWGQQIREAVADCKETAKSGRHGIGDCVSAFATQHGTAKRAEHGQDKQSNDAAEPDHAKGKKPSDAVVSPAPDSKASPTTAHPGQGGLHKPDQPQTPEPGAKPHGHPTPSPHSH
jgi:hypothetical protein